MKRLNPKEFIQSVLIDEIQSMLIMHPYISFIIMGIGIEFLGKCIDTNLSDWNVTGRSKKDFQNAIKTIPSLKRYETYLVPYDLYGSFRCGLAHAVSPKFMITLSSKNEQAHLVINNGRLNLKVEDFFTDFKNACEYVIKSTYPTTDKMNSDFLKVPGNSFNVGTDYENGITSSLDLSCIIPPTSGATH